MARVKIDEHFTIKNLLKIAIPSILVLFCFTLSAFIDGVILSQADSINQDSSRTLYTAFSFIAGFMTVLYAFSYIAPYGGAHVLSKALGEKDYDKANRLFFMLFTVSLGVGLLECGVGIAVLRPLLKFLGADPSKEYFNVAVELGIWQCCSIPFFSLLAFFREMDLVSEKQTRSFIVTIIFEGIHMGVSALCILVFKLGIKGIGIAALADWGLGAIYYTIYYFRMNNSLLRVEPGRYTFKELINALYLALPNFIVEFATGFITMLTVFWINKIFGSLGETAVAANESAYSIFSIVANLGGGYTLAVVPVIAYNYGKGNKEEIRSIFKKSLEILLVMGVAITILVECLGGVLANIFVSEGDVEGYRLTRLAIMINNSEMILLYVIYFFSSYLLAKGHTKLSLVLTASRTILWPVMIFTLPFINQNLVFFALGGADIIMIIVDVIIFIKLNKTQRII